MFAPVDFGVFGIFLLLSMFVGLYHGVAPSFRWRPFSSGAEQSQSPRPGDFLDGGRRLPILPVCLSLLTTFVSGIGLLGIPAEIYTRGTSLFLFAVFGSLSFPLIGVFFVPIFFKLKCLNAYEYFELRFHSGVLRRLATLIFMFNTLVYMAVVVYTPSIALSGVTGLQLWPFILLVGMVSTIYTAAGGIKAVIWTDTLQAFFIYAGLAVIVIKGTIDTGGFLYVLRVNDQSGHTWQGLRVQPSLLQYSNIWVELLGGITTWTSIYGLNQMAMQRYCSMPSLHHARIVVGMTVPANLLIQLMVGYIGLLMVAFFKGCDPVGLKEVKSIDQLTIRMADRIFDGIPGLPGLFLATIFSATLSTSSSGINSLTAVLWEDFIKESQFGKCLSDEQISFLMKKMSIFFGLLAMFMAFACSNLGGIFQIINTILGASSGPLVGIFLLGIFFPRANKIGAFAGLGIGISTMVLLSIYSNLENPYKHFVITSSQQTKTGLQNNATAVGCVQYNTEEMVERFNNLSLFNEQNKASFQFGHPDSFVLTRLSPLAYALFGVLLVLLIGVPISLLFRQRMDADQKWLSLACTWQGVDLPLERPLKIPLGTKILKKPLLRVLSMKRKEVDEGFSSSFEEPGVKQFPTVQ